jgi:hypothetical protein
MIRSSLNRGRCAVPGLHIDLSDDRKTLTITAPTKPVLAIRLPTEQLDDLIKNLGEQRARMRPPVTARTAGGQTARAMLSPAWSVRSEPLLQQPLLQIRDVRFGWLHYSIPIAEARKLSDALLRVVAAAKEKGQGKPN